MFIDRTLGTIVIQTGIHESIIKRRVSAGIGERQENIIVVCVTLPVYGVGTRLRNVASREVMSMNHLCIPGTKVSTPSQPLILVETASIRWPKTGSSSREWVAGRKTGPVLWSWQRQTPVLMRLIFPVITAEKWFGNSPLYC